MQQPVTFDSDGLTLSGVVHAARGATPGEARPAVLVLHGFGTSKEDKTSIATCEMFAGWGYTALRFDYRGCGESGGEPGRVICLEEVEDTKNALTFMAAREDVDGARIAVMGHSFGAAVAVYAGGVDERIAAVISSCGWGNGEAKFRLQHKGEEAWAKFTGMLAEGKRVRAETGKSLRVDRWDIVPIPEPLRAHLPANTILEFPAETAQSMFDFTADDVAGDIAPRPLLLLHASADSVTPTEQSLSLFAHAGQPTDLVLLSDVDHWPLAGEKPRARAIVKDWLGVYLPLASTA